MQIETNNNTAKIISGILATISIVVIARIVVPAIWFWIGFEVSAALLVAIGCAGEWYLHHHPAGRKKVDKEEHHKLESRFIAAVIVGVFMEFFSLGHAIPEAVRLEKDVASANDRAFTNELQVVSLNRAVIQLAHQYDLSTNALAEANARLRAAKVKSPKEVLIDCLNSIDPKIVQDLASATKPTKFTGRAEVFRFSELEKAAQDPDVSKYISLQATGSGSFMGNGKVVGDVSITLDPSLLK